MHCVDITLLQTVGYFQSHQAPHQLHGLMSHFVLSELLSSAKSYSFTAVQDESGLYSFIPRAIAAVLAPRFF